MNANGTATLVRWGGGFMLGLVLVSAPQPGAAELEEQVVEVTIKDYTFVTKQVPLQLNVPITIAVRNEDAVRHDFGSSMFQGSLSRVESDGIIAYGKGIGGVYLDPKRQAVIRLTIERPGTYQFKCSIHPQMKGEILLLAVNAV